MSNTSSLRPSSNYSPRHTLRHHERLRPMKCVGNWQLTQLTGRGSFTDVYLARPTGCRPNWPADYAVKMLRPQFADDELAIDVMRREVEVASQVSHQHLVAVLEAQLDGPQKFIVMPRLKGVSIGQVLTRTGHISVRQSLWIARQIAEALDALHTQQWLHGDIKPENVMLSPDGHVTLIDLGFALRNQEALMTEMRTVRGTLSYVAPETMTSAYSSDARSDIYALGITLFEMLTGKLPFESNQPGALIEAHRSQPLPDPRQFAAHIPADVVRLISIMTAKQPSRRPQNVRSLVNLLLPLEVAAMKNERVAG